MADRKSYWIWHYGDYENHHFTMLHMRREEFGASIPAFWKLSPPAPSVQFSHKFTAEKDGYLCAHLLGCGSLLLDGKRYPANERVTVTKGEHHVIVCVCRESGLPALYIESDVCTSDGTWCCNTQNSVWGAPKNAPLVGLDPHFDAIGKTPDVFPFSYRRMNPIQTKKTDGGLFLDFGEELFGYLFIENAEPASTYTVYYGESEAEAMGGKDAVLREAVKGAASYRLTQRAFRYIYIKNADETLSVFAHHEYLPLTKKGSFSCSDTLLNDIYGMCERTFHLNCREGFFDGIKRDRWVWGGDAYQSARINAYLFADRAISERTLIGLIGREPIDAHINTIVDYSLFWVIALYEHHMAYGDIDFLSRMYPLACRMMEFLSTRLNEDGMIVGREGDWTFIDWASIDKTGAVCAEQMLLIAAYDAFAKISDELGKDASPYTQKKDALIGRVNELFWDDAQGAYIDSYESGKRHVTRHANIFAVMYGIASKVQCECILKNVLLNDQVPKITTPYFRGYELDACGKLGVFDEIEHALASYWGGMRALGAETVWEEYDPSKSGEAHYAMYGDKYTKSLCHAWGATPIYLFGRYYLGVHPTAPGYETFSVEPHLGGLSSFSGSVPVGDGIVKIELDGKHLSVCATKDGGTLIFQGKQYPLQKNKALTLTD